MIVGLLIGLLVFAAVIAVLTAAFMYAFEAWARSMSRRRGIILAALGGALPLPMLTLLGIWGESPGWAEMLGYLIGLALIESAGALVVGLPVALLISRRIERKRPDISVFD